jgi:hypothetical protein
VLVAVVLAAAPGAQAAAPLMPPTEPTAPAPPGAPLPVYTYVTAATPAPALARVELEQLTAPIALYPDALVTQILLAAAYPLDVVKAVRWLAAPGHAALQGDALASALAAEPWDPSVKSLVPFPSVLQRMDENLGWTEKLGLAFAAQQAETMDAIQHLRAEARAAGTLDSNDKQTVRVEQHIVYIEPAVASVVYVPFYDPWVVYGAWPYPGYPPYYWGPPPGAYVRGWWWGPGYGVVTPLWGWGWYDWHRHDVLIDAERYRRIERHREPPRSWRSEPRPVAPRPPAIHEVPAPRPPAVGTGPAVVPRVYRIPPRPPVVPRPPSPPAYRAKPRLPGQGGGGGSTIVRPPATRPPAGPAPAKPVIVPPTYRVPPSRPPAKPPRKKVPAQGGALQELQGKDKP